MKKPVRMDAFRPNRYHVFFGVVALGLIALLIWVVVQGTGHRKDLATFKAAQGIATKIDTSIQDQYSIPASLAAAGIKHVPATVSYKRLSSTEFKLCIIYQTDTRASIFLGSPTYYVPMFSKQVVPYLAIPSRHTKGQSCQVVKPYINTPPAPTTTTPGYGYNVPVCNRSYSSEWAQVPLQSWTAPTDSAVGTLNLASIPPKTYTVNAGAKVLDRDCQYVDPTLVKPGDYLDLYFDANNNVIFFTDSNA